MKTFEINCKIQRNLDFAKVVKTWVWGRKIWHAISQNQQKFATWSLSKAHYQFSRKGLFPICNYILKSLQIRNELKALRNSKPQLIFQQNKQSGKIRMVVVYKIWFRSRTDVGGILVEDGIISNDDHEIKFFISSWK